MRTIKCCSVADLGEYDTVLANSLGNPSQPQPGRPQMSSAMSLDLPLIPDPTAPQPILGIPQQGYDPTSFANGGMPHIGQDPNDPKPHSEVRAQPSLAFMLTAASGL